MPRALTAAQKLARRQAMIRAYRDKGMTSTEVAKRFKVKRNTVFVNMARWGVKLSPHEARSRMGSTPGSGAVWADCPEHLQEDYDILRKYHGARAARRMLEGAPAAT